VRINQYIAAASGLSRRAADTAIAAGRVTVDGRPALMGESVEDGAEVRLNDQRLHLPTTHIYVMLHKPVGYVTSRAKQGSDPTIYDLLPPAHRRVRPVGRLDRDSSGLLLLSDDGAFIQHYTHPGFQKGKVYELELDRAITPGNIKRLEQGVKVAHAQGRRLALILSEGRNRQIRRTLGAVGYLVKRLHRTQVGPYQLGKLASGQWQAFEPEPEATS
jgi:23S rRNA pseudouridine2605 synthase